MPKKFLREYFVFSKKERNGTLALLFILCILIIVLLIVQNIQPKSELNLAQVQKKLDSLKNIQTHKKTTSPKKLKHQNTPSYSNNIKEEATFTKTFNTHKTHTLTRVEINTSDSAILVDSANIRTYLAKNIIKYRSLLGGYYNISQLKEVYGVKEKSYTYLKKVCFVDSSKINKININTITFKKLLSHPYFDYDTVKKIINQRKKEPISPKSLKNLLKQDLYIKIAPYLYFNEPSGT